MGASSAMARGAGSARATDTESLIRRLRHHAGPVSLNVGIGLVCLILIFPVYWAFVTSLKEEADIMKYPPILFPSAPTIASYVRVLEDGRLVQYIFNTFILATGGTAMAVLVSSLAGYAFSRFLFPGRQFILVFILATIMIPGLTQLIPLYMIIKQLGMLNTLQGLIVVYGSHGLPFTIWIMKSFFDAVPIELEEAALIDGCNPIQALFQVIIPISAPGLMAASVLSFVGIWNEFLTALVFTSKDSMRNVSVGLYNYLGWYGAQYQLISSAAILVIIPVLIIFILGRQNFVRGMVEGALKG